MIPRFAKFAVKARQHCMKLVCMEHQRLVDERTKRDSMILCMQISVFVSFCFQLVNLLIEHKANVNAASGSGGKKSHEDNQRI